MSLTSRVFALGRSVCGWTVIPDHPLLQRVAVGLSRHDRFAVFLDRADRASRSVPHPSSSSGEYAPLTLSRPLSAGRVFVKAPLQAYENLADSSRPFEELRSACFRSLMLPKSGQADSSLLQNSTEALSTYRETLCSSMTSQCTRSSSASSSCCSRQASLLLGPRWSPFWQQCVLHLFSRRLHD